MPSQPYLDEQTFTAALNWLAEQDPDLSGILKRWGPPPMWVRDPGFPTLIHIILEQQVSLASARAAFNRLQDTIFPLTPEGFLTLDDDRLKAIGFSRQKSAYGRILAQAIKNGDLNFDRLHAAEDETARAMLVRIKGIGNWTADIYLLMALRRPDVWPQGDLALINAVKQVKNLPSRPTTEEMNRLSSAWRPWRAVAARCFWHDYLSRIASTQGN